jgi:serpin B
MHQTTSFDYGEDTDVQVVRLPYQGDVAMVVLLPAAGNLAAFEEALAAERLDRILASMEPRPVALTLPRWSYTSDGFRLKPSLEELGMRDAFAPGRADFSGIDGTRGLIVDDVYHKAMVVVDEEGTEAAAATGSSMMVTSAPAPAVEMRVDRPFIFLIQDTSTGALLFAGRIVDPLGA